MHKERATKKMRNKETREVRRARIRSLIEKAMADDKPSEDPPATRPALSPRKTNVRPSTLRPRSSSQLWSEAEADKVYWDGQSGAEYNEAEELHARQMESQAGPSWRQGVQQGDKRGKNISKSRSRLMLTHEIQPQW